MLVSNALYKFDLAHSEAIDKYCDYVKTVVERVKSTGGKTLTLTSLPPSVMEDVCYDLMVEGYDAGMHRDEIGRKPYLMIAWS
jgi:hypothetical protein